jgi:RND family efflux transporter MFP subunit
MVMMTTTITPRTTRARRTPTSATITPTSCVWIGSCCAICGSSLAPAAARSAAETVTALGELRVNEDAYAEVGTPIAARVARIAAGPGDRVRAGQVLAELDSPDVGRARAAVATAEARVALSRQTAERRRQLAADQLVPARELQEAEAELTQAEVEVAAARQALVSLGAVRGSGATLELVSPLSGTVIDRNAIRGRMVEASAPLFVVGDLSRLWLIAHVFERDALRLRLATQARVSFPALPGQTFTGTVTQLGSRVDPASRTIDVRVVVDNTRGQLRPGHVGLGQPGGRRRERDGGGGARGGAAEGGHRLVCVRAARRGGRVRDPPAWRAGATWAVRSRCCPACARASVW